MLFVTGLPHRLTQDDVYQGMVIPKGSLVFANIWAMMRDERVYEDAEKFWPERFCEEESSEDDDTHNSANNLEKQTQGKQTRKWRTKRFDPEVERRMNPKNFVFGFGRRECPGKELVDSSIWLVMVSPLFAHSTHAH